MSGPSAAERRVARIATAVIVAGIALRLVLVFALPFGQQVRHRLEGLNDEPAHFRYIQELAVHHAFPVQTARFGSPGTWQRLDFGFYQPPLYYLMGAGLYAVVGPANALHACRLLSALCGLATLLVLWRVLRASPLPRLMALATVAFASLYLTHAYFCAVASNDALSWLLAALVIERMLALAGGPSAGAPPSPGRGMSLAALLAASALTKSSLLVLFPLVALVYAAEAVRRRSVRFGVEGLVVLVAAVLIAHPWYVLNLHRYGSLFAFDMGFGPPRTEGVSGSSLLGVLSGTSRYFWFPMQHVKPSSLARLARAGGMVVLLLHLLAAAVWLARRPASAREAWLALTFTVVLIGYVRFNLTWSDPEARYLFPAFVPMMYGLAAGAWGTLGRTRWATLGAIEILALSAIPFVFLALV